MLNNKKKKKQDYLGEIYYVHPKHLVSKKDWKKYAEVKQNMNLRPVAVTVVKKTSVQVSKITKSKPRKESYATKLEYTNLPHESFMDNRTLGKSKKTGKKFKLNENPLLNKSRVKIDSRDLNKHEQARKKIKSH